MSDTDREREYSPSSCVGGDIAPLLKEYSDASETARQQCAAAGNPLQSVSYGPLATQTVDVVAPAGGMAPAVVFIHGGYWQDLSKRESFSPASRFLSRGVAYAAVDYTLAPAATLDQIVAECRAAVAAIVVGAEALGIERRRILLAGSSAGAHLAAMVALDPASPWRPAGMVLLSGIYELEPLIGTTINDAVGLDVAEARRNSPARLAITNPSPSVIAWGANETHQFKEQSRLFAAELRSVGSAPLEVEAPGRNHFDILSDLADESSELGGAIARLIDSSGDTDAQL